MSIHEKHAGLALLCDAEGRIEEIVRNDVGLSSDVVGRKFSAIVERNSMHKALDFLLRLRRQQAAFNWELSVSLNAGTRLLHFAGGALEEQLLIVGTRTDQELKDAFEEMMRIGNEQANALRRALKGQREPQPRAGDQIFDEISRLNNELVSTQRELAKKNAELAHLNELKNRFLGMAAHDLRNPLNLIYGFAEVLESNLSGNLSEEEQEYAQIIMRSSRFMTDLVNDLLDVAQIESGKLQLDLRPVDLEEIVAENVRLNQVLAANKEIELRLEQEPLPPVPADPQKIAQILNNLIGNAVKFSHAGSTITVRVQKRADRAVLTVADEGEGIPSEKLQHLFKPFSRASAKGTAGEKGTGLGLMIVKKIVEGHGGEIGVESTVGEGTTFTVLLPLAPETDA